MSDLEDHVAWLRAKVTLDEEAGDPEGMLLGLSEALRMAQEALRRAAEPFPGVHLTVWADGHTLAVLDGFYESLPRALELASATVADLVEAGQTGIQTEIRLEGESNADNR